MEELRTGIEIDFPSFVAESVRVRESAGGKRAGDVADGTPNFFGREGGTHAKDIGNGPPRIAVVEQVLDSREGARAVEVEWSVWSVVRSLVVFIVVRKLPSVHKKCV